MYYDALIVGAGPAGSAAARVLATQGHAVALLDKARHPRPKLCGGLLTWKTRQALERVFGLDLAALRKAGVVQFETDRYDLFHRGRSVASGRAHEPFVLVDRPALDALLAGMALDAGAALLQEARVARVDHSPEQVVVATDQDLDLAADYLLGCDGATSLVRRSLGPDFTPARWTENMARAVEFRLDRAQAPAALRDLDHPQLHLGHLRAGYGWVFPNQDSLLIGQCGLADPERPFSLALREFLGSLGIDPQLLQSKAIDLHGHPLPYGNYLDRPAQGRTLLCGDAAGLVEPTLGEGIFYALLSGAYAGHAVAKALSEGVDPIPGYLAKLARNILPELRSSNRLRWTMLSTMDRIGTWPVKLFMRLPHARLGDMVHGLRSYAWTRRKTWEWE